VVKNLIFYNPVHCQTQHIFENSSLTIANRFIVYISFIGGIMEDGKSGYDRNFLNSPNSSFCRKVGSRLIYECRLKYRVFSD